MLMTVVTQETKKGKFLKWVFWNREWTIVLFKSISQLVAQSMNIWYVPYVKLCGRCSQCQRQTLTYCQEGQAVLLPQESCTLSFGEGWGNDGFFTYSLSNGYKLTEPSKNIKKTPLPALCNWLSKQMSCLIRFYYINVKEIHRHVHPPKLTFRVSLQLVPEQWVSENPEERPIPSLCKYCTATMTQTPFVFFPLFVVTVRTWSLIFAAKFHIRR